MDGKSLLLGFLIAIAVFVFMPIVFSLIKGLIIAAVIVLAAYLVYAIFSNSSRAT